MAPEMIKQTGHNKTIDYYCLGVLLYEMIAGIPPYYS
jgi:serine/threonine protein kinase